MDSKSLSIKMGVILEKYEIKDTITRKKVIFFCIRDYFLFAYAVPNLRLNVVDSSGLLEQLDLRLSKIFYRSIAISKIFFCQLILNYDDKNSRLRFILIVLDNENVRICGHYIHNSRTNFYSYGPLPLLYSVPGIGTQMILKEIKIARKFECKYIPVYCIKLSVTLYKRLGFRVLGTPVYVTFYHKLLAERS